MAADAGTSVAERLRREIADGGPITFARFMEAALYDPHGGYFSDGAPVGERGDFVTSPHVSPAFGFLVARQLAEMWELLDRPTPFHVVEVGAGDGTLARQLIAASRPLVPTPLSYVAVEPSPRAQRALRGLEVLAVPRLSDVPRGVAGVVLANELLDNLPFHRVRMTEQGPVELLVGWDDGFVLVEAPLSDDRLRAATRDLASGQESVMSLEALRFVEQTVEVLQRGYVWLADYAADGAHRPHGYRRHRLVEDVLAEPGSRDITAGVDIDALARHARELGLEVWGPRSQRDVLLALGFAEWEREALRRQREALDAGDAAAAATWSARNRARMLIDPAGLGAFAVLCLGVGPTPPPRWARGD